MKGNGKQRKPRIFIGVPCYGKVDPEHYEDMIRFAFFCGRFMPQFDFDLGVKTKSEQFRARNAIVDGAQQCLDDWLLMIDDDMIINTFGTTSPSEDYRFIERLIAHDKDICGVLYHQRGGDCAPVMMKKATENGYRFFRDDEITHGLQECDVAGGGCLLIRMSIFDKLKYPYFEPEFKFGTDIQLCRQAQEKGFKVWADTSIELGHLRTEKTIVTSRNRHQFQLSDPVQGEMKRSFVTADIFNGIVEDGLEYTKHDSFDDMVREANRFLELRKSSGLNDADWYRTHGRERVSRQIVYNTQNHDKRLMTEFILGTIDNHKKLNILDFGCGIGIPAFTFAQKGHNVTAMDIRGTGTFEFLRWRAKKHGVPITFVESEGGPPNLTGDYDAIVAMDCIEHIEDWRFTVAKLGLHLKPLGVLFSNNGILVDNLHPEHYSIDNKEFIKACLDAEMMPFNQIAFVKKENSYAKVANS